MGFVCGTINQLSFNKNRRPDERQREETWGVGSYLGRKKAERVKKQGREEREREKEGVCACVCGGGVLDPDPGLQSIK